MRRITILIGAMAALMLVPAAQAFAETAHMKVNMVGTGSGEVQSVEAEGFYGPGTPPIACTYDGTNHSGSCENTPDLNFEEEGYYAERLEATPAEGSEFVGWTVEKGEDVGECPGLFGLTTCIVWNEAEEEGDEWEIAAEFTAFTGPALTVVVEEGEGTVVSNPAGIECFAGFGEAPKSCTNGNIAEGTVTLTASPASGYAFKSWKGCDKKSGEFGVNGRQCTIDLNEAKSVSAKFVKVNTLTLENGGNGKVSSKPGGALCLPNCSKTVAFFEEGKTVEVLAKPNKHFHLASWGGVCSGSGSCSVTMDSNKVVTASFAEDPKFKLAIAKIGGGGQALIKTKGPGTVCSYTCSQSSANFYTGEEVTVSWKLNKGTSSLEWTSGAGTCTGTFNSTEGSCTVTMSAEKSLVAKLE